MKFKDALLVVDVQNDFCPKGALGIRGADKIVPILNKYIKIFEKKKLPVFITRDWHPKVTSHFKSFGGKWPKHCVQGTKGSQFYPGLKFSKDAIIVSKGMDPDKDSYSAFHALDANGTELVSMLKILGVSRVFIGGLATDYCVRFSVHDAIRNGLKATVLLDAVKGVDLKPKDSQKAIEEMISGGAMVTTLAELTI